MKNLLKIKEKLTRSLITRDRTLLYFTGRKSFSWARIVNNLIQNYDNFDYQSSALGNSRIYRKIAQNAERLGKQQAEKFFYSNYATRDLIEKSGFDIESDLLIDFNLKTQLELNDSVIEELQHPPPIKNSLITNINLSARLLPAPTLASA